MKSKKAAQTLPLFMRTLKGWLSPAPCAIHHSIFTVLIFIEHFEKPLPKEFLGAVFFAYFSQILD